ncbi:MAG TPA: alanine racemase [Vicinamibacteria bacterium]
MNGSRRLFLKSAAAVPALSLPPRAHDAVRSSFDPWVEVREEHLRHNVAEIHRRVGGRPILAVIKNNGYGLGVAAAARAIEPEGAIAGFAVVKLHEAVTLRDAGVRKPILCMGPLGEADLDEAVARGIAPMVYTPLGPVLERIAARRARPIPIHVCVDTGIGRVGVPHREAAPLIRDLAQRRGVKIEGTMMTFTEDPEFDREQLRRFQALCGSLADEGVAVGRRHAASSFALFQNPEAFLDMVRPGMAIYGVYSEPPFRGLGLMELRPAVALRARVAYVKKLPAGDSAGYNRAYLAREDVWVATLPVGHADGLPRAAAKGGRVRIGGRLFPLVATVSASHCIAELGGEPLARSGDVATFFDWEDGSRPEDLASGFGGSVYDLLMHLNPLLPRRTL